MKTALPATHVRPPTPSRWPGVRGHQPQQHRRPVRAGKPGGHVPPGGRRTAQLDRLLRHRRPGLRPGSALRRRRPRLRQLGAAQPRSRWLFVTNAGSNDVSVFRVHDDRLELTDVEPTGDGSADHRFPNSVAQHGRKVYVLNSGRQRQHHRVPVDQEGQTRPIPNSTRGIEANQDRFAPIRCSIRPRSRSPRRQTARGQYQGRAR